MVGIKDTIFISDVRWSEYARENDIMILNATLIRKSYVCLINHRHDMMIILELLKTTLIYNFKKCFECCSITEDILQQIHVITTIVSTSWIRMDIFSVVIYIFINIRLIKELEWTLFYSIKVHILCCNGSIRGFNWKLITVSRYQWQWNIFSSLKLKCREKTYVQYLQTTI